ncbi:hypothetical protein OnM2_066015 [Erysiphe neolycopersici]|uniref:CCHC-type domain-containing protein n=1 Tax=Erysiphe neolycopersici TaxID=212602 RepID=A0A420HMN3_9PEZI|nr:hypothetical protein OnM2_066015 [Erysiphe neolycopersici]
MLLISLWGVLTAQLTERIIERSLENVQQEIHNIWKRRASSDSFGIGGKYVLDLRENDALRHSVSLCGRFYNSRLCSSIIRKSVVNCGSLFSASNIFQYTLIGMQNERKVEARLAQEKEYSDLKSFIFRGFESPASADFAVYKSGYTEVTRTEDLLQAEVAEEKGVPIREELPLYRPKKSSASSGMRPTESANSLPPINISRNPLLHGTRIYRNNKDGQLCIRCDTVGRIGSDCPGQRLESWE